MDFLPSRPHGVCLSLVQSLFWRIQRLLGVLSCLTLLAFRWTTVHFLEKKGGEEVSFDRPVTQASKVLAFDETEIPGVLEGALCLW